MEKDRALYKDRGSSNRYTKKERLDYHKKRCKPYVDEIKKFADELASLTDETKFNKEFKEFIEIQKYFWQYSLHNQILIKMQKPDAKRVAGYNSWREVERYVKRGEKAIKIFAPIKYYKQTEETIFTFPDGHTEKRFIKVQEGTSLLGFRLVNVFDISQTQGKELPKMPDHRNHTNNRPDLLKMMEKLIQQKNINLVYSDNLLGNANGMTDGKSIYIKSSLSIDDKFQTAIHEYLHFTQHFKDNNDKISRKQKEIEAEATSYIVSKILGLESKSYNYIALWNGNGEEILKTLTRIADAIRELLNEVETIELQTKQMVLPTIP